MEPSLQESLLETILDLPSLEYNAGPTAGEANKRKRGDLEDSKKPAKKNKRKKRRIVDDADIDVAAGLNNAFAHMDSQLLADYVAQQTRKHESNLSSVELEDKYIPGLCHLFLPLFLN